MSNTSKPNGGTPVMAGDIHAQIALEAASLRNLSRSHVQDAHINPALSAMLCSARAALDQSIPKSFKHEGRTYWLRALLPMVRLTVFDEPTASNPMALALSVSEEEFGHVPGH